MIKKKTPGVSIPTIAIAGGISNETSIFKALAIGAPFVRCVAMARAPITAAMKGKYMGNVIANNAATPAMLKNLGFPRDKVPDTLTLAEAFAEYDSLIREHGGKEIPPAAVGVYSYFSSKLGTGIKQLLAGTRKFKLDLIGRKDIATISHRAYHVCEKWDLGIATQENLDIEQVKNEIYSGNY
jgi:hypothetical protein